MANVRVTDTANFKADLERMQQELPAPYFVLFVAGWCPDCTRAVPSVERVACELQRSLLLVEVGMPRVWKDPNHPFRLDPALKLKGVPTLVHWTTDGPGQQLARDLEKAPTAEVAAALARQFMQQATA